VSKVKGIFGLAASVAGALAAITGVLPALRTLRKENGK
jgi:hypothetical protein